MTKSLKRISLFKGKGMRVFTFYEGEFGNYCMIQINQETPFQVSEQFGLSAINDLKNEGWK